MVRSMAALPPALAAHRLIIGNKCFSYPLLRQAPDTDRYELNVFDHEGEATIFLSGTLLLLSADLPPQLPLATESIALPAMQALLDELQGASTHLYLFAIPNARPVLIR